MPLVLAGAAAIGAEFATHAVADIVRFRPSLILEQLFTDNVRNDANDRDADGVTSVGLRLNAALETSRLEAGLLADVYYNEFWATDEFDDANGRGSFGARLTVLHNRLFIDGAANRQEVFLTPESTSASGLGTGSGTSQQTDFAVGPLLTTEVFGLADLAVRATYAQVLFDEPLAGPLLTPIDDLTAKSAAGRISTGQRHRTYELTGTAEYLETDADFQIRNVVGHVMVHLVKSFTAIGRYGYERIEDPAIPLIHGTRWSAGGRYTFSEQSAIQLEYGHRFGRTNWFGEVDLQLSPRVAFHAQYTDVLGPAQLSTVRPIEDLFDDSGNLNLQSAPSPIIPNPALVNQIVRDKNFTMATTYTRGLASYSLTGRHTERIIPGLAVNDKLYSIDLSWREVLSRSLTGSATIGVFDNYDPPVGTDASKQYRADVGFVYLYSTDVTLTAGYLWSLDVRENEGDSLQNVVRFGVEHAF